MLFSETGKHGWVFTGETTPTLQFSILEDIYNPLTENIGYSAVDKEDYTISFPKIFLNPSKKHKVFFSETRTEVMETSGLLQIEIIHSEMKLKREPYYINIEIIDNKIFEMPEFIFIAINDDTKDTYSLGNVYTHIVKINDDDHPIEGSWCITTHLNTFKDPSNKTIHPLPLSFGYKIIFNLQKINNSDFYGEVVRARAYKPHTPILDQIGKGSLSYEYFSPSPVIEPGTQINGVIDNGNLELKLRTAIEPDTKDPSIYGNRKNPFPISLSHSVNFKFPSIKTIGDITEGTVIEDTEGLFSEDNRQSLEGKAFLCYYGQKGENIQFASPSQYFYANRLISPDRDYLLLDNYQILDIPSKNKFFLHSDYQNLHPTTGTLNNPGTFLGGGGSLIEDYYSDTGTNPGTSFSFGHPFAGIAYLPCLNKNLGGIAEKDLDKSTSFYFNKNITKGNEFLDIGPGLDFDEKSLINAERYFVSLIHANPFNENGVTNLMKARIRRGTAYNILTDRKILQAFNKKFQQTSFYESGEYFLIEEINLLEEASKYAQKSSDLLFELLADKQYRGIGEYLRGEVQPDTQYLSNKTTETLRLMTESVRRYAEIEMHLARKNLLLEFMDADFRKVALNQLMDLEIYLTEAVRALSSISDQRHYSYNGLGVLKGILEKIHSMESGVQQGHNAFGFVNDFVPFLIPSNQQTSHSDNVLRAIDFAQILIEDARSYQLLAQENMNAFNNYDKEYREKAESLSVSYNSRLKSLCGIIENKGVVVPDDRFEPDIFTYPIENISERENLVSRLPGSRRLRSFGEIAIQHQNIQNADDRIKQAINEMGNLVKEMEIHQEAGSKLAEGRKNLAELVLANGQKIALLTRQKGILQKEAIINNARLQKRSQKMNMFRNIAYNIIDFIPVNKTKKISDKNFESALFKLMFDNYFDILSGIEQYRSIQESANIQGDLAVAQADIDATILEIRAMEQAEVHFQAMRDQLIRTEEQLKVLALRMANLQIQIRIAERDMIQQEIRLGNMFAEVDSLLASYAKQMRLADEHYNLAWLRPDHRAAMNHYQYDAEESFFRAQCGTYIAVRALEYYLNECIKIDDIYEMLYTSRRVENLEMVLTEVKARISEAPLFVDVMCPGNNILSLKYDLLSSTDFEMCESGTGEICNIYNEDMFTYYDKYHNRLLRGRKAYNAAFRDFLRDNYNPEEGKEVLEFTFSTDILPRRDISLPPGMSEPYEVRNNPLFYSHEATGQVILGFEPPNCKDPSQPPYQGISINFTSPFNELRKRTYVIELSQVGNMTLRSSSREKKYNPDDPTEGLIVYSTYQQKFPIFLHPRDDFDYMEIGSYRKALLSPRINNDVVGTPNLTLAFTDRSVANDQWIFRMYPIDADNRKFLDDLDKALDEAITDPGEDFNFISDIQFRLGWSAKVIQYD